MCNFLYCCIDEPACQEPFLQISHSHGFVPEGRVKLRDMYYDPKITNGVFYRITGNMCDCGSALGRKGENAEELRSYLNWLKELKKCRKYGLKAFYIMKIWEGRGFKRGLKPVETVHIEDVDAAFLANIDEDRIYRIEYFRRYGSEYTQVPV